MAIKNENIKLLTSSRLIDYMARRPTHLAARMARDNRVVNLCSSSFRNRKKSGVIKEKGWETRCFYALPLSRFTIVKKINEFLYQRFLKKHIKENDIIWAFEPFSINKYKNCKRKLLIYEMCDDTSAYFKNDKKKYNEVIRQEEDICREADIAFTISDHLWEKKKHLNENFYVVRNGVDFEYFNQALNLKKFNKDELYSYKPPIIGYHGAVSPWLDFELIKKLARIAPNFNFVFIGRIKAGCQKEIRNLSNYANIHFLGERKYHQLVHYLKYFDVAIIPFIIDQLILSVSPIKMYEYLAAGKPVISTPLPEVNLYEKKDLVEIAVNADEFKQKIVGVLNCQNNDKMVKERINLAAQNSWDHRYEESSTLVNKFLSKKGKK